MYYTDTVAILCLVSTVLSNVSKGIVFKATLDLCLSVVRFYVKYLSLKYDLYLVYFLGCNYTAYVKDYICK